MAGPSESLPGDSRSLEALPQLRQEGLHTGHLRDSHPRAPPYPSPTPASPTALRAVQGHAPLRGASGQPLLLAPCAVSVSSPHPDPRGFLESLLGVLKTQHHFPCVAPGAPGTDPWLLSCGPLQAVAPPEHCPFPVSREKAAFWCLRGPVGPRPARLPSLPGPPGSVQDTPASQGPQTPELVLIAAQLLPGTLFPQYPHDRWLPLGPHSAPGMPPERPILTT